MSVVGGYPWRLHGARLAPIPAPAGSRVPAPLSPWGDFDPHHRFLAGKSPRITHLHRENCHFDTGVCWNGPHLYPAEISITPGKHRRVSVHTPYTF